ncbi:hypothetical protein F4604DRAFT_1218808 [Suillus subluteus]|nr:hypothetical protein F4604DRAFT_1218808 [Suillus subluteus]
MCLAKAALGYRAWTLPLVFVDIFVSTLLFATSLHNALPCSLSHPPSIQLLFCTSAAFAPPCVGARKPRGLAPVVVFEFLSLLKVGLPYDA